MMIESGGFVVLLDVWSIPIAQRQLPFILNTRQTVHTVHHLKKFFYFKVLMDEQFSLKSSPTVHQE
ncbi:hypothetical protein MBH78_02660 [Oceanimonas sp. NS1]|nr:hypothetical protein [Oceanimonas sp. NS1]